jgi:hypothetical protein
MVSMTSARLLGEGAKEIRQREVAERQERQAIERDRQWREQLNRGVRWYQSRRCLARAGDDAGGPRRPPAQTVGARVCAVELGDDPPQLAFHTGWGLVVTAEFENASRVRSRLTA